MPTAAPETCQLLRAQAEEVICAITPQPFHAVGLWYEDFPQVSDEEVRELLAQVEHEAAQMQAGGEAAGRAKEWQT